MKYWWVNHNQTFKEEINGGYIWAPKANRAGQKKVTYTNLTKVSPNDLIFSFARSRIMGIGIVTHDHKDSLKPSEFGKAGDIWDDNGWMVPVEWVMLDQPIVIQDHLDKILSKFIFPHSPLNKKGTGNQNCYLANIPEDLGTYLLEATKNENIQNSIESIQHTIEDNRMENSIMENRAIHETMKLQLINARIGQGVYRLNLGRIENHCRFTDVDDKRLLIASHIKPWRKSNNDEKLDGYNGLLLSPHADKMFDGGYISIDQKGKILTINEQIKKLMTKWGIDPKRNIGRFKEEQLDYLSFHENEIFYRKLDILYERL